MNSTHLEKIGTSTQNGSCLLLASQSQGDCNTKNTSNCNIQISMGTRTYSHNHTHIYIYTNVMSTYLYVCYISIHISISLYKRICNVYIYIYTSMSGTLGSCLEPFTHCLFVLPITYSLSCWATIPATGLGRGWDGGVALRGE